MVSIKAQNQFTEEDLKFIAIVGAQAGIAVENARLYDSLEKAQIAQQEKIRFTQVMVHELKSPLAAVKLMHQTISSGLVTGEKCDEMESRILTRMDDLQNLIVNILKYSRMADENIDDEVQLINLPEFVSDLAANYRHEAEMKDLKFIQKMPDDKIEVRIDVKGLELIISNLLSNAVKYTHEGYVQLSLRRKDHSALIKVTDTGIGIPAKDVPNLFKEFFRASNARKANISGTGVGLAGIKCIVEKLGGSLDFQTKENEGSCFTVTLNVRNQSGH